MVALIQLHPLDRYQGHVSAALVLGGVDFRGPHLFTVYPHGSTDALPYATMGSGSLNAMAVFEDEYKCASARFDGECPLLCSQLDASCASA